MSGPCPLDRCVLPPDHDGPCKSAEDLAIERHLAEIAHDSGKPIDETALYPGRTYRL